MLNIDSSLHGQLEEELRKGWQRNRIEAAVEARQLGKLNNQRHKSIEGLGQKIATIPGHAFHFWGQKLGYECWNDKEFMDEFLRDNPELRVNSGGTKEIQVGWTPTSK
jgi:hypothetical protein